MPNEVKTIEHEPSREIAPQGTPPAITPLVLLQQAITDRVPTDVLRELTALWKEWDKEEARKDFEAAFVAAKGEFPVIRKNRHVGFKSKDKSKADTSYWHEDLAEIYRTVDPILAKHGMAIRCRPSSEPGQPVIATAILSHKRGYFEETTLKGAVDPSGNKNHLQAIGSAITFLSRYAVKSALGLASERDDDDAQSSEQPEVVSEDQAVELREILEAIAGKSTAKGDVAFYADELCGALGVDGTKISDIPSDRFDEAKGMLAQKLKVMK